jgi:hypothetical protein
MYAPASSILAVGFVTWGFVAAGVAAMSIPIIIHILNRKRFKTVTWAAMEFLLRAMKKNRRRLRFEQWLLLATRCAVVALLGMALARPLGCENSSMALVGGRSGVSVFVIDNSYSMAYEVNRPGGRTHLDNAKRIAKDLVDRAARDGGIAVVVASNPAHAIVARPSYDPQDVKSAIDRIEQSYSGTDLPGAMQLALQIAKESDRQPDKSLELFTDSTASAWRNPDQAEAMKQLGPEVARVFRVAHHNLSGGEPQSNAAAIAVRPQDNLVTSKFPADFAALPRGYGSVADASVQWKLNEQPLGTDGPVKLTPDTREIPRTNVKFAEGGPQVISVSLAGGSAGDRLSVDDTRWRVVDVAAELNVLIVEGRQGVRPGEGSGFFLREALSPPRESGPAGVVKTDSYVAADTISVIEFGNKVLDTYAAVMLCDVGQIPPTQAEQLERFVRRGGTLFWFMGEQVSAQSYNDTLLPRKLIPGPLVKLARVGTNEKGYLFDFDPKRMPFLRAFENQENTGLETVEVFTYWQTEVPQDGSVQAVLRYQGAKGPSTAPSAGAAGVAGAAAAAPGGKGVGDPAITIHSLGTGKVVFCTTSANDQWTTLPSNISFVTIVHELFTSTVRTGDWWLNLQVGDALAIPPGVRLSATPTLSDPAGRAVEIRATGGVDAGPSGAVYRSDPLRRPGVYSLQIATKRIPVAVNVPDNEADVRTLPDAAIKESLGGIDLQLFGHELPPDALQADAGNDLSWTFMLAVLALLAVECVMAMRFGHYRRTTQVPAEAAAGAGTA